MSTFKIRVEDIIGSVGDDTALADWLTEGARRVILYLPESKLENYPTTALTDSGTGVSIATYRPIRAHKSGYGARRIDAGLKTQAGLSGSIHYATTVDPVWYIELSKAFVLPSGGSVIALAFPTISHTDETAIAFPTEHENAVVLYAAIRGRLRQIYDLISTSLGGLAFSTQTPPTAPDAPSFVYVDASGETISSTSISFSDTLSYSPPVFTGIYTGVDSALTNQDVELASGHLSKINTQLDLFQKDLFNSLNDFNKEAKQAELNLQEAISQAQLTQQRLIQQAELTTNVDLQNKLRGFESQVSEYRAKLEKYGAQMQAYVTQVNEESQRFNSRIQQYIQQSNSYLAQLQLLYTEYNEIMKDIRNGI